MVCMLVGEPYGERSHTHSVVGRVLRFKSAEYAQLWKRKQCLSEGWKVKRLPLDDVDALFG